MDVLIKHRRISIQRAAKLIAQEDGIDPFYIEMNP
jgi:hypothetical protein